MPKVIPWRLLLVMLLTVSMLASFVRNAQAQDMEGLAAGENPQQARVLRGYMDENGLAVDGQTSFNNFLYISDKLDGVLTAADGKPAYCFNLHSPYPPLGNESRKPHFTESLVTGDRFHGLAVTPYGDSSAVEKAILSVTYNGFDNNAAGLKEFFGLSDGAFYEVTQNAIWHFTDSALNNGASPNFKDVSPEVRSAMQSAYQVLIGNPVSGAPSLHPVPEEMALNIYLSPLANNGTNSYQHLLSAEPVHKETGEPLRVPKLETLATTENAENNKIVEAEGGKVIDTVTMSGLKDGETYTLLGRMMEKDSAGKPLITEIAGKTEFVAGTNDEIKVEFQVPAGYAGKELVVFEYLFKGEIPEDSAPKLEDLAKRFVGKHEDINDADQTVRVADAPFAPPAPEPEENTVVPPAPEPPVSPETEEEVPPVVPPVTPETEEDVPPVPAPPAPIVTDDEPPAPVPPGPTPIEEEEVPPVPAPAPEPAVAPEPAPKPSPKPADMGWIITILTGLFGIGGLLYGITGTPTYQADRTPNRPEEAIKSYRPAQPAPAAKAPVAQTPAKNVPTEAVAAGQYNAPTGVRGIMARTGVDITMFALALFTMAAAALALVIRRRRAEG